MPTTLLTPLPPDFQTFLQTYTVDKELQIQEPRSIFSRIYSTTAKCATSKFKNYNKYVAGKTPDLFCLLVLVSILHLFYGIMIRGAIPTKIECKKSRR